MKATTLVLLSLLTLPQLPAQESLKIFLLAGQSNMEGQAYTYDNGATDGWNITTMEFLLSGTPAATEYLSNLPHTFKDSLDSSWLDPRSDVWCAHYDSNNGSLKEVQPGRDPLTNFVGFGPLSPGFGVNTNFGSMIGAELGMGIRIGDATPDPSSSSNRTRAGRRSPRIGARPRPSRPAVAWLARTTQPRRSSSPDFSMTSTRTLPTMVF